MRPARRILTVLAVALLAVGVLAAGLAVLMVLALPLALALELVALALVAAVGTQLRRRSKRRPTRSAPPPRADRGGAQPATAALRWTTEWDSRPPVDALPVVREHVTAVLTGWGLAGEASEPTLLVITELVTNAAEHGRGPSRLAVEFLGTSVRVEVDDGAPEPPRLQPPDPMRIHGRGLQLVDALSTRWGWLDDPPGKVVWADVPTAWPDPPSGRS